VFIKARERERESESERESEREKEREKERERERERQVVLRQDGGAFLRRFFFFSEALFFFLPQYCGRMEARTRTCLQDECMEAYLNTVPKIGTVFSSTNYYLTDNMSSRRVHGGANTNVAEARGTYMIK
jgi:hypothetical protein